MLVILFVVRLRNRVHPYAQRVVRLHASEVRSPKLFSMLKVNAHTYATLVFL